MKITKSTLTRLNKHSSITRPNYDARISAIAVVMQQCNLLLGEAGKYELNDGRDELVQPIILSDGAREVISGKIHSDYSKKQMAGLAQRFPKLLSCTFTHGLNGVNIYDVNTLVRVIVNEI